MLIGRVRFDTGLNVGLRRNGHQMREFAKAAEGVGFDVLTFPDHLVPSAPHSQVLPRRRWPLSG